MNDLYRIEKILQTEEKLWEIGDKSLSWLNNRLDTRIIMPLIVDFGNEKKKTYLAKSHLPNIQPELKARYTKFCVF